LSTGVIHLEQGRDNCVKYHIKQVSDEYLLKHTAFTVRFSVLRASRVTEKSARNTFFLLLNKLKLCSTNATIAHQKIMIDDSTANVADIESKFEEYAKFVRDVLRPDYRTCQLAEQEIRDEIAEYNELTKRIANDLLPHSTTDKEDPLLMNVDLGHGKLSCRAIVDMTTTRTIFVHIGMGFHVEYTFSEALIAISKRIDYLNQNALPHRIKKSKIVLSHIQSSERILDELSNELRRMK
jgi:prefoldin subunit 5